MSSPEEATGWIERVLRDRIQNAGRIPDADRAFFRRCRDAARASQDVLRMRHAIADTTATTGSLTEWLLGAADLADVPRDRLLSDFEIPADRLDATAAVGWGRLSRQLGLRLDESLRSFRHEVVLALRGSTGMPPSWTTLPVRARQDIVASNRQAGPSPTGDDHELTTEQRHQLRDVMQAFLEAFQTGHGIS